MIQEISAHLREKFKVFSLTDNIILNNKLIFVEESRFQPLQAADIQPITYIDGGQAEIVLGGNLSLSFIRLCAQTLAATKKQQQEIIEFYLLVTARFTKGELWYDAKIFPVQGRQLIRSEDLTINSVDTTIRNGLERAPLSKVAAMARRFAELALAAQYKDNNVLLDGTLQATVRHEERYLGLLGDNVSALAKTCSLFTTSGNSPVVLLQKISPYPGCWSFMLEEKSYFVKLHQKSKHVFRFEGNYNLLPSLLATSTDPLFLGYPYGLLLVDKMARVSEAERKSLRMNIMLRAENRELSQYLAAANAHEILDSLS